VDCLQKYLQLPKPAGANDQTPPTWVWLLFLRNLSNYANFSLHMNAFLGGGKGGEITVKWMFPCISIFGCPLHRCYFKMTPYLNKH